MKKLNVEKWNKLRLALEGKGASYRNDAPLFEAMGVPVFDWRTRSLLKALVSSATAEPERSRRHAESHVGLYRGYAAGKYNVKPEDQKAYSEVLEAWDSGKLDPVALANTFAQQTVICDEVLHLTQPKRGVFQASDFKGGSPDLMTWLYAIRSQYRQNPRLHFTHLLPETQASLVEKAIAKAPLLLGALFES
jgi:hypothetical protein